MGNERRPEVTGLLGGSYNPIHIGHLALASYLTQWNYVDTVWLTLTPLNPLKDSRGMLPDLKRLDMISIALQGLSRIESCDIELTMPKPNYTINTLDLLSKRYPHRRFKLVIGADNWKIFDRWRDHQRILDEYGVIVYPRPGYPVGNRLVDGMEYVEAPMVDISSTFVRDAIARDKDMTCFLPPGVAKYIADNRLYVKDK